MNFNPRTYQKIAIGLIAAIFFLTIAYFVGLLALIASVLWLIVGFIVLLFTTLWSFLSALFAGTWLVALVSTLVTWFNLLLGWFAGTWLGSIFVPIYNLILPIALKVAPFFSIGNGSAKLMKWYKKFRQRGEKNLKTVNQEIQQESSQE